MKRCSKCGDTKPCAGFAPDNRRADGCQAQCRDCQRAYTSSPAARELTRQRGAKPVRREHIERRRLSQRAWLDSLKTGPCVDCDNAFPPECMDFDHVDPSTKSFCVTKGDGYRRERVLAEIEKCELVCANCHRVRTWKHRRTAA